MKNVKIELLKDTLRNPFAWPGGYEKAIYLSNGSRICHICARKRFREIVDSTKNEECDAWGLEAVDIYWEGEKEECCDCGDLLASEYGPIEENV